MSVILGIKVERTAPLGEMRKELAKIRREVMRDVGNRFVSEHLKPHFGPANRQRFKHEKRNDGYLKRIKPDQGVGDGRFVDNVLTGRSKRQVMASAKVVATRDRATVRATVPGYFAKPFIGSFLRFKRDKDGRLKSKLKQVTRQPDKVKELGTMDQKDVEALTRYALRRGRTHWRNAKVSKRKKV